MRLSILLLALATGCDDKGVDVDDSADDVTLTYGASTFGDAPTDPVGVYSSGGVDLAIVPVLIGPDGVELRLSESVRYASMPGVDDHYRAAEPLAPGEYQLVRLEAGDGQVADVSAEPFEILPYGIGPGFDAASVLGRAYRIALSPDVDDGAGVEDGEDLSGWGGWLTLPGFTELAKPYAEAYTIWLQLLEVEGGSASFQIIGEDPAAGITCAVLRDTGDLSPEGQLSWSREALELETAPEITHLQDLSLAIGWLPDGSRAGGGEAWLTGTTAALSAVLFSDEEGAGDPGELCSLIAGIGLPCVECEDGAVDCLELAAHRVHAFPDDDVEFDDSLPMCGVDLSAAEGALSCDIEIPEFDCSCSSFNRHGSFPAALLLIALLRARRREPEGRDRPADPTLSG